jgi:hypothetical protein
MNRSKPETDPEQEEAIVAEFARRRRRQWILVAVGVAPIFVVLALSKSRDEIMGVSTETTGAVAFVFVLAMLAYSFFNWRCPACSGYLGRGGAPSFCPKCGARLK